MLDYHNTQHSNHPRETLKYRDYLIEEMNAHSLKNTSSLEGFTLQDNHSAFRNDLCGHNCKRDYPHLGTLINYEDTWKQKDSIQSNGIGRCYRFDYQDDRTFVSPENRLEKRVPSLQSAETSEQPGDVEGSLSLSYPTSEKEYIPTSGTATYLSFKEEFAKRLKAGDYEPGEVDPSEDFARDNIPTLGMDNILHCMQELALESQDENVFIGILHALSHFDYKDVYPEGQLIAAVGLVYDNDAVNEFALKAFENWDEPGALSYLRRIKAPWLENDLIALRSYLERQRAPK